VIAESKRNGTNGRRALVNTSRVRVSVPVPAQVELRQIKHDLVAVGARRQSIVDEIEHFGACVTRVEKEGLGKDRLFAVPNDTGFYERADLEADGTPPLATRNRAPPRTSSSSMALLSTCAMSNRLRWLPARLASACSRSTFEPLARASSSAAITGGTPDGNGRSTTYHSRKATVRASWTSASSSKTLPERVK